MKFYSEVTKKLYESEEELNIAEKAVADEKARKKKQLRLRRQMLLK